MNDLMLIVVMYNTKISDLYCIKQSKINNNDSIDVFIYDNSLQEQTVPDIYGINFHYVHDKKNAGVSKGYNVGIEKAKELNKKYVILLDQDSNISCADFEKYTLLYNKYGDDYLYAPIMYYKDKIYSPGNINNFAGKVQDLNKFMYKEVYSLEDKSLINSGLLIPLKIIDLIGNFNENIKLDFSDFYFIEKYKKFNNNMVLLNLYVEHSLSGDESKNYLKEISRYKYYCNGAKYFNISAGKIRLYPALRRMLRLIVRYKSLKPIYIFVFYFLGSKRI